LERGKAMAAKAKEKTEETTREAVTFVATAGSCFAMSYANQRWGKPSAQGNLVQIGGDPAKGKAGVPVDAAAGVLAKGAALFGVAGKPSASGGLSTNLVIHSVGTGLFCAFAARKGAAMGAQAAGAPKTTAGVMGAGAPQWSRATSGVHQGVG